MESANGIPLKGNSCARWTDAKTSNSVGACVSATAAAVCAKSTAVPGLRAAELHSAASTAVAFDAVSKAAILRQDPGVPPAWSTDFNSVFVIFHARSTFHYLSVVIGFHSILYSTYNPQTLNSIIFHPALPSSRLESILSSSSFSRNAHNQRNLKI